MKQILYSTTDNTWPEIEIEFERPVRLFVDTVENVEIFSDTFNILWVKEVEEISRFKQTAISYAKLFDAIITYDEEILQNCPNAWFMAFGTAWVWDYDLTTQKKFQVSHLTGFKEITYGHRLRKEIYFRQPEIQIPTDFYISRHGGVPNLYGNKVLGDTKTPMFNSMFHLCIENTAQKNCFTEKIIDCLITKTIPVYYGCSNICDFFDTKGFFIVQSADEAITTVNNLRVEDYFDRLDSVQRNYFAAKPYMTLLDRLKQVVDNILSRA
jgi:hypothetical protein